MPHPFFALTLLAQTLLTGLPVPLPPDLPPPALVASQGPCVPLLVIDHGIHAGLVLAAADVPPGLSPLMDALALQHPFVEIGWGDTRFYQAGGKSLPAALDALLTPDPGALHLTGFDQDPRLWLPEPQRVEVALSPAGRDRLLLAVEAEARRSSDGFPQRLSPALYGRGSFWAGRSLYSALYTCNGWTAERLQEAGLPVRVFGQARVHSLMVSLRRLPGCAEQ